MVRLSTWKKDERRRQDKRASSTVSPAYILRSALGEREREKERHTSWDSRVVESSVVGLANSRIGVV